MKTLLFPGQGTQVKGMGAGLFDEFPNLVAKADKILGYSIRQLCLEDEKGELRKTQFTQPAIYVVSALCYFDRVRSGGVKPDFVAGNSLGELNALLAAGAFSFEAGLKIVKKRGELMGLAVGGSMAAILNCPQEKIESVLAEQNLNSIEIASYNTRSQIVISGLVGEIERAGQYFCGNGIEFHRLNTSGAFHSRHMIHAQNAFQIYLKRFKFSELTIPVISNVSGEPYLNCDIAQNLASQLTSPVKWVDSMEYLLSLNSMEFEEVGQSRILTNMLESIRFEQRLSSPASMKSNESVDAANSFASVGFPEGFEDYSAREKVSWWNKKFQIGVQVASSTLRCNPTQTRTEARVIFGHRAVVYLDGFRGYFTLDELMIDVDPSASP